MAPPETKRWLTDAECAQRFGISRPTWWRWVREGKAPRPVKLGAGTTRWALADIEEMEARARAAAE